MGHIAFSEYRLALGRIRGERPGDDVLFSLDFKRLFGADSGPQSDSTTLPLNCGRCWTGCLAGHETVPAIYRLSGDVKWDEAGSTCTFQHNHEYSSSSAPATQTSSEVMDEAAADAHAH